MRPKKPNNKPKTAPPPPQGPWERAEGLLQRLESGGPNPENAAEELDRLQGRLQRDGRLDELAEQVHDLCADWSRLPLKQDRASAWLTLVGAFRVVELEDRVREYAAEAGQRVPLRIQACRVLAGLAQPGATAVLLEVLRSRSDAQVRAAAAEALADLGDRTAAPELERLLDTDLPAPVWRAVSAARDRLG